MAGLEHVVITEIEVYKRGLCRNHDEFALT